VCDESADLIIPYAESMLQYYGMALQSFQKHNLQILLNTIGMEGYFDYSLFCRRNFSFSIRASLLNR
jgi:hypothetical protein